MDEKPKILEPCRCNIRWKIDPKAYGKLDIYEFYCGICGGLIINFEISSASAIDGVVDIRGYTSPS